jgi:hypothetical protein
MGQQQAKKKATEALRIALDSTEPSLTQKQKETITECFEKELRLLP